MDCLKPHHPSTPLHPTPLYTTPLHITSFHFTLLHDSQLHRTPHSTSRHFIPLQCVQFCFTAMHYFSLSFVVLLFIALHSTWILHCTLVKSFHRTSLHYYLSTPQPPTSIPPPHFQYIPPTPVDSFHSLPLHPDLNIPHNKKNLFTLYSSLSSPIMPLFSTLICSFHFLQTFCL